MARTISGTRELAGARQARTIPTPYDCFYFDGVDDYIEIADNDAFSVTTTGEITISAWMKIADNNFLKSTPSSDGAYVHWLGKGVYTPTDFEYAFRMYNQTGSIRPNRTSFYVFNTAAGTGVGSYVQEIVTPNEWVHIVGSIDATSTYIWKNGVLKDSDVYTASITPANGTSPFRIGAVDASSSSSPNYFRGFLRDIRVWDKKLTNTEVTNLYNGTDITSGLVAKLLLNEKSGSIVVDSVNGYNGVVYGAVPSNGTMPINRNIA